MLGGNHDAEIGWANGRLTIDLSAIQANWKLLDAMSSAAETGACVKANAYGHGLERVGPALAKAGCRNFFVAIPQEGIALRNALNASNADADIYVFNGEFHLAADAYSTFALTPVIYSLEGWRAFADIAGDGSHQPYALHVDTGMNRLGLRLDELEHLPQSCTPTMVMSHFACADTPEHPLNRNQINAFETVTKRFPGAKRSLANSAGILAHPDSHLDLTRPGIALYGGEAVNETDNPMQPAASLHARILQVRTAKNGETVGYGAAHMISRDSRLAIVASGYADGVHRSLSGSGVMLRDAIPSGGFGAIDGKRVPMVGRVSMDLTAYDVTDLPEADVDAGMEIELFGSTIPVDEMARAAGTIGYEVLTSMGSRYHRSYLA